MKKSSNIESALFNAIWSGTRIKVILRIADPDDAATVARGIALGFVDYAEYKPGTERPVAIGNRKEIVRSWSEGAAEATHTVDGESISISQGHARSVMQGTARAVSSAVSASSTQATAQGTANVDGVAYGQSAGEVDGSSLAIEPYSGVLGPPMVLGQGMAHSSSVVDTNARSNSRALSRSSSDAISGGRTDGVSDTTSEGVADTESETVGQTRSRSIGHSRGITRSRTEGETFTTEYQSMRSQLYSASEQHERFTGEIMRLALRECFVVVDNRRPVRTRTADLPPTFRSQYFKRLMLPLALSKWNAHSPYLQPAADVDSQIAARCKDLVNRPQKPEPDFTKPEPMPFVDEPTEYGKQFLRRNRVPTPDDEPPKPKRIKPHGRKPVGDLPPAADRFTVIDGGEDGDKSKKD